MTLPSFLSAAAASIPSPPFLSPDFPVRGRGDRSRHEEDHSDRPSGGWSVQGQEQGRGSSGKREIN